MLSLQVCKSAGLQVCKSAVCSLQVCRTLQSSCVAHRIYCPLNVTFSDLPGVRMVGNLPFNVSIPLLLQWLEAIPQRAGPFAFGRTPMALVFQKEVADVSDKVYT